MAKVKIGPGYYRVLRTPKEFQGYDIMFTKEWDTENGYLIYGVGTKDGDMYNYFNGPEKAHKWAHMMKHAFKKE